MVKQLKFRFLKAKHFNDEESAIQIMQSTVPSTQKKIGAKVKGFDAIKYVFITINRFTDGTVQMG